MTISGALSNAISGLRAAGRGAEVVSANIANAMTPGYGRRVLELSTSSAGSGGGVRIDGISRIVDSSLASDRRLADARQSNIQGSVNFLTRFEEFLGTPNDPNSITARLAGFENALITAASRPDAPERLAATVTEANSLVQGLRDASEGVQAARSAADTLIASQVDRLNTALGQVVALNQQITAAQVQGGDVAGLQDFRQRVLNEIGALVPVRDVPRDNGQIALYTTGGTVLLDGTAAQIGFERSNVVTPYMSVEAGTLSGLTINGTAIRTGSDDGPLRGGAIGAQFAIRDELGVNAQAQVDTLARDVIGRFQDPSVDPTLATGDAGLFTDSGGAFNATDERGISARIALNPTVDPDQGGATWRIRDGINAVVPGATGDSSLLQNLSGALNEARVPGSGGFGSAAYSLIDLTATITAGIGSDRAGAEQELAYSASRLTELTERQLAEGVDTDAEFQRLLLIEQSYAANARVIEAVEEMMQTILRL